MEISKNISLKCGVCGNTNFEYDETLYDSIDNADKLKCKVCNKIYTPEELREANSSYINDTIEEVGKEIVEKTLKKLGFKSK